MTQAVVLAQDLTAAGFVALGAAIGYRWYRDRGRAQGTLAVALIALAVAAALSRLPPSPLLSLVVVIAFMLSGYFVLMFRNEFMPLGRTFYRAANVLLGVSILCGILAVTVFQHANPALVTLLGLVLITSWAIFTGEPIVRFWLASNRRPAVPYWGGAGCRARRRSSSRSCSRSPWSLRSMSASCPLRSCAASGE
ncbi:MAG: hypothetical protein E6J06_13300 [Chloroflexi bacterium]|nr:MAG: hypothetical protein E6J06_13300 [Chloroflexota bacterium]